MSLIARRNRLPDSLPVVVKLLERHPEGASTSCLQQEIEKEGLWDPADDRGARSQYHRVYGVLKLLRDKGLVRAEPGAGEIRWVLDFEASARQRRKELFDMIKPFVDGCLLISDTQQLLGQLNQAIQDGTIDVMVAERRAAAGRTR